MIFRGRKGCLDARLGPTAMAAVDDARYEPVGARHAKPLGGRGRVEREVAVRERARGGRMIALSTCSYASFAWKRNLGSMCRAPAASWLAITPCDSMMTSARGPGRSVSSSLSERLRIATRPQHEGAHTLGACIAVGASIKRVRLARAHRSGREDDPRRAVAAGDAYWRMIETENRRAISCASAIRVRCRRRRSFQN